MKLPTTQSRPSADDHQLSVPNWALIAVGAIAVVLACGCSETTDRQPGDDSGSHVDGSSGDGTATGDGSNNDGGVRGELVSFDPQFATIPIHVADHANVRRAGSPVVGGIPFGRGVLQPSAISGLVLADDDGRRVTTFQQPVVLGSWNDGSVKWLQLAFTATFPAGGSTSFTLGRAQADTAADPAIEIVETDDAFTVDTGALKAVLSKQTFSVFDAVWVDANNDGRYEDEEQIVSSPGEMLIDLDTDPPGAADSGADSYPDTWYFGMEGGNWLRDSQSDSTTRYLASAGDYEIKLFRQGRTHVVFRLQGWHKNALSGRQFAKYTLYLHFYAKQRYVRAGHTWIMTGDPDKNFIRRMAIELPLAGNAETLDYAFGGAFETHGTPVTFQGEVEPYVPVTRGPSKVLQGRVARDGQVALVAIGPDKYYHNVPLIYDASVDFDLLRNGQSVATGTAPSGWGSVSAGGLGMAVGVRDFWREHPKEVQYQDGKLAVYLWPDHGDKTLDLRRRYAEVRGPQTKPPTTPRREFNAAGSAVGIAKTTDLFLHFFAGNHDTGRVDDTFRGFEDPLRPFVSGEYNVQTGVFGPLVAHDPTNFTKLENYLDLMMSRIMRSQQEYRWYGWLDYGDYLSEFEKQNWELDIPLNTDLFSNWGYGGWLQEAYRFGQWAFVQYFRSGRHRYFRAADTWLRHTRDVDCVYWDKPDDGPRPGDNKGAARLGGGHRHDQQHWGTYMAGYGIPTIALVHHYFMTGEGRDLDAMRANADWIMHAGSYYENYGEYSVLYMAEALDDSALMAEALAHNETPRSAFGRATYDSGMGLMMHDIQTNGAAAVRAKLRKWADLEEDSAAYLRAYLESQEQTGAYSTRIKADFDKAFPASSVRASRFGWAPRVPSDFRDVFSADIMPDGPWEWPLRVIESVQFDGPGGMGYDLGRHSEQMALMWLMAFEGQGL